MGEFIESLKMCGRELIVDPPHGNRVGVFTNAVEGSVEDGTMPGSLHFQHHILPALYLDDLLPDLQIFPVILVPDLIGIFRIQFFAVKIHVVILEHGDAPSGGIMVSERRHGRTRQEIPVDAEARAFEMCLVPHGGLCEGDVCVIGQDGLTGFRLFSGDHPSIGTVIRGIGQVPAEIPRFVGHFQENHCQCAVGL